MICAKFQLEIIPLTVLSPSLRFECGAEKGGKADIAFVLNKCLDKKCLKERRAMARLHTLEKGSEEWVENWAKGAMLFRNGI